MKRTCYITLAINCECHQHVSFFETCWSHYVFTQIFSPLWIDALLCKLVLTRILLAFHCNLNISLCVGYFWDYKESGRVESSISTMFYIHAFTLLMDKWFILLIWGIALKNVFKSIVLFETVNVSPLSLMSQEWRNPFGNGSVIMDLLYIS